MPKITWQDSFSIGNEEIDEQHKRWIEILNRAHDHMISGENAGNVGRHTLIKMLEYTRYHFSFEEAYMEKIGYPGLEAHRKIHQTFCIKLEQSLNQMDNGVYILSTEIIKTTENWLVDHILNEDRKITAE